jgi:hypothetical protein
MHATRRMSRVVRLHHNVRLHANVSTTLAITIPALPVLPPPLYSPDFTPKITIYLGSGGGANITFSTTNEKLVLSNTLYKLTLNGATVTLLAVTPFQATIEQMYFLSLRLLQMHSTESHITSQTCLIEFQACKHLIQQNGSHPHTLHAMTYNPPKSFSHSIH